MTPTNADRALVTRARETIAERYDPDRSRSAAALRTDDGNVHIGLHLDATVASSSTHAEAVALGRALAEGATAFDGLAVVAHPTSEEQSFLPVPPCGECRELLVSHAPDLAVVYAPDASDPEDLVKRPVRELLPDAPFPRGYESKR
jgi:cytidine deaminase